MPRRPNYSYERMQRERAKSEKKEAKAAAKAAQKARRESGDETDPAALDGEAVDAGDTREAE